MKRKREREKGRKVRTEENNTEDVEKGEWRERRREDVRREEEEIITRNIFCGRSGRK